MSRKDFLTGLITGVLIAGFIVCVVLCIRIGLDIRDQRTTGTGRENGSHGSSSSSQVQFGPAEPDKEIREPEEMPEVSEASILSDPEIAGKVEALEELIRENYIEDVEDEDLANGLYNGLMESLNDPYASYYTPEEWISMQQETVGIYYGIGAYLSIDTETLYPRITGIIRNTPAEESGLMEDDIIVEVDGEDVYDMDLTEVVSRIKGEEGTKVHLVLIRGYRTDDQEELEFDVERRRVEAPTVTYEMMDGNIAYIQITEFDSVTVGQFEEALASAKGAHAKGLVLDLRSNPGGSVGAVVRIARMLLPEGRIVYTVDKYGHEESYDCDGSNEIDIPMVVLVNGNSASAAEILAGAIKDYGVGTLLGTQTFGKGIVQQIFTLSDGSAMKLTVSHYYTPLGNDIHKVGIEPDIVVEFDRDAYIEDRTDNQLEEALELLQK